jgi:hypothetical protein
MSTLMVAVDSMVMLPPTVSVDASGRLPSVCDTNGKFTLRVAASPSDTSPVNANELAPPPPNEAVACSDIVGL